MKKQMLIIGLGMVFNISAVAGVCNVTARQLFPWPLIEVAYEMTDDRPGGVIRALGDEAKTFVKRPTFEKGIHHVIWDAGADGFKTAFDAVRFTVEVAEPVMPLTVVDY